MAKAKSLKKKKLKHFWYSQKNVFLYANLKTLFLEEIPGPISKIFEAITSLEVNLYARSSVNDEDYSLIYNYSTDVETIVKTKSLPPTFVFEQNLLSLDLTPSHARRWLIHKLKLKADFDDAGNLYYTDSKRGPIKFNELWLDPEGNSKLEDYFNLATFRHSEDFLKITILGDEYNLSARQATVLSAIYDLSKGGSKLFTLKELGEYIDRDGTFNNLRSKLTDVFSLKTRTGKAVMSNLISSPSRGKYRFKRP